MSNIGVALPTSKNTHLQGRAREVECGEVEGAGLRERMGVVTEGVGTSVEGVWVGLGVEGEEVGELVLREAIFVEVADL